jgi:flagellar hook-length control protein FliK
LARALTALTADAQPQKTASSANNPILAITQSGQAAAVAASVEGSAAIGVLVTDDAATPAKAVVANRAATYSFAAAARALDPQNIQHVAQDGTDRPATSDVVPRAVQAATPASKATIEIDVDASVIKARQSSLAFQAPVRTDGTQVQAVQGGQQASIALATPIVAADANDPGTVVDQIVKAIRIQVRDGIGEVRLRLQPEHMGEVHIALTVDRDRVSAVLQVERPEVRAQIEGQGQTLRASLAAQGLQLEELTVRDDGQSGDGGQRGRQDTPERRRRQSTTKQFELEEQ